MARRGLLLAKRLGWSCGSRPKPLLPPLGEIFSSRIADIAIFASFAITVGATILQPRRAESAKMLNAIENVERVVEMGFASQVIYATEQESRYQKKFETLAAANQLLYFLMNNDMVTSVVKRFNMKEVAGLVADLRAETPTGQ